MNFRDKLDASVKKNNSLLCVGLDPDVGKIPKTVTRNDIIFAFLKDIVDATADLVCAFKPNSAFFEAEGAEGISKLKKLCDYIRDTYPEIPIILDAKRGDVDNTNPGYVAYSFDYLGVDAITVNPYLGGSALQPFLDHKDKGIIILCKTSNPGADEIENLKVGNKKVYQVVAEKVRDDWNKNDNCLLVVGATYPKELADIRSIVGDDIVFLVPGIGAQGGEVEKSVMAGINSRKTGIIVNSSRGVIYASDGPDFAEAARKAATKLRDSINEARD